MKIVTILGARPQFVKAAVVSRAFKESNIITEIIIHTGQHFDREMSDVFFEEMDIPLPNYFLGINGKSHAAMTGQMMEKIEEILIVENPKYVLVYGDTNSTLAGAIACKKLNIKLIHIEAGLRSFNNKMPEEINRIVTDRISDLLFCPTETAMKNLNNEGINNSLYFNVGDVMQDAVLYYSSKALKPSIEIESNYILCTIHRAENTDDDEKLSNILKSLETISKGKQIILPLHPRTKNKIVELGYIFNEKNILVIPPVGYLEMVYLLKNCDLVMTDSGGLQKEAYMFNKLCITLRDETEWVELIESGNNILAGSDYNKIVDTYQYFTSNTDLDFHTLYGNGVAAQLITQIIIKFN
ncbi:non-hydrolyzing UDP-N-acetylglucosamine 2-epimerase [Daejeonella sp.]|jgi:UDP-GlcNAc3NAcA epimerase|uniref:non-hydrolyzing UDP-N-acetylglucosamine 2-epimerase n=1 Tax=Daejeonella sp. TaxID=2805397 RepID=UPI0037C08913